jgi:hypothetical protein
LTSFSIVTARLELAVDASSALCADKRNPPAQRAGPLGPIHFVDSRRRVRAGHFANYPARRSTALANVSQV